LLVAVVYMTVVAVALGVTACVVLAIYCEPNQPSVGNLAGDSVECFNKAAFWVWTRFT